MYIQQRTLAASVNCIGVGLHSGQKVHMTVQPAPVNHGIKFVRTDLPDRPEISAIFSMVVDTSLATVIGHNGCIVSTIEHLMAAFAGLSIDNARVELDAYEVPVMDGSAGPFARMLRAAGIVNQKAPRHYLAVNRPFELTKDGKSVGLYPEAGFRVTCCIDFSHPLVGKQAFCLKLTDAAFEQEICNARTFGFLHELDYLKQYGLGKGGSLDNAVVVAKDQILNKEGLRYADEFVRHKLLDSLGDFSLLGLPLIGHLKLDKSGHAFNHEFIRCFLETRDCWETRILDDRPATSRPAWHANAAGIG
jgi:UDP-3-O-[3-hydroxymyristoyl] N-acetylglucosamine deacetylase